MNEKENCEKPNENRNNAEDFTCPDCGRKSPEVTDSGNGFCKECALKH